MELCRGLVVISAIFGGYDRIRKPMHVRKITAENVCFFMFMDNATLTELARYQIKLDESHRIGIWCIDLVKEFPYKESIMNGLIPKYIPLSFSQTVFTTFGWMPSCSLLLIPC